MDNQLICCVDMFARTQVMVTPEGEKILVEGIENLGSMALDFCLQNKIGKIHFFGDDTYISGLLERKPELTFGFKNNNIVVEVN
jgi:hypothetical protein